MLCEVCDQVEVPYPVLTDGGIWIVCANCDPEMVGIERDEA